MLPDLERRLAEVCNGLPANPPCGSGELVRRFHAALGRLPLGLVAITPRAVAALPVDVAYAALLTHRLERAEPFMAGNPWRPAAHSQPASAATEIHSEVGEFRSFIIGTLPARTATLILLKDEEAAYELE